jgi:hypothetical protein
VFSGPLLDVKLAALSDREPLAGGRLDLVGGDPTRLSAELIAVWADDLRAVRAHTDRLPGAVTAFASAFSAMFIRQRPTLAVLEARRPDRRAVGDRRPPGRRRDSAGSRATATMGGPPDRRSRASVARGGP